MTEPRDDFERRFARRYETYLEDGVGDADAAGAVRRLAVDADARAVPHLRMIPLAVASMVIAVVLILSAVELLPHKPAVVGPSASSASPGVQSPAPPTPLPVTWPTVPPSAAIVPAQLDLARLGFWTLEMPMTDLSLNTLRIGTLDGRVTRTVTLHAPGMGPRDIPLQPEPAGPAGGRVVYVADNGREAVLHVVQAVSGVDRELVRSTGILARLALDPSGAAAYYLVLDRATGAFADIVAISTDGGEPRVIISSADVGSVAAVPFTLAVQASWFPHFAVSMDGRWVVFASCRPSGCDLFAAPAAGGAVRRWTAFTFNDSIVGIVGDLLIGSSTCEQGSCDGFALDLRSGKRWPHGDSQGLFAPKQLIAGPRGPLVLGETDEPYAQGKWHVLSLDLTDRTRTTVFAGTFRNAYTLVRLAQHDAGAELPAGWFLVYRNADAAPAPYPNYSAAKLGGTAELPLPIMTFPK